MQPDDYQLDDNDNKYMLDMMQQSVFTKKMIGCEVHCARKVVRLEILSKK